MPEAGTPAFRPAPSCGRPGAIGAIAKVPPQSRPCRRRWNVLEPQIEDAADLIRRVESGEIVLAPGFDWDAEHNCRPQQGDDEDSDNPYPPRRTREIAAKWAKESFERGARLREAADREDQIAVLLGGQASGLPPMQDAAVFTAEPIEQPPELIAGLLHQTSKLVIGAPSKARKTWLLLDLAISVAHGIAWLGHQVTAGKTLYLNLEIGRAFFQRRILAIAQAKGLAIKPGAFIVWNLRGASVDYISLLERIAAHASGRNFSLVVIDPLYKMLGAADENSARDITELLNRVERLATSTGAAIAFASHFAKGNAAAKNSIDRISGSGVFARDPDSFLTLTENAKGPEYFSVEATLRNFKPLEPFVIKWTYPLFRRDGSVDPSRLKQAKGGRPPTHSVEDVLKVLSGRELRTSEWLAATREELGVSAGKFYECRKQLETSGRIVKKGEKWGTPETPETPF